LRLDSAAKFLARVKVFEPAETDNDGQVLGNYFDNLYDAYWSTTLDHSSSREPPLAGRVPNFDGRMFEYDSKRAYNYTALALIPAICGAVHIGTLGLSFPSEVEKLLWKISCYTLIISAFVGAFIGLFLYLSHHLERK
jgi:hypothetical protein